MKKKIKNILKLIGVFISITRLNKLGKILRFSQDWIYTGIYKNSFQHFGDSILKYPLVNLIGSNKISIGDGCIIEKGLQLEAWGENSKITIGNNCLIRANSHITAYTSITIGDDFLSGTNILISDNSHGDSTMNDMAIPPRQRPIKSKGEIIIGKKVWLGNNVSILSSVIIGDGAIIGANSVVTRDIPPYSVAVGCPAKIVKYNKE